MTSAGIRDPDYFLFPTVILWNPVLTYDCVFSSGLKCITCAKVCQLAYWNDGSSVHTQPRLIHDIENFVYLVSAVYVCEQGHRILAHDQIILSMLPCKDMIPFVLLHKTGFTTNFVNLCASLCQNGMNFHSLEAVINYRRWKFFESRRQTYLSVNSLHCSETSFPLFNQFAGKYLPSDDIIRQCFLAKFLEEEAAYITDIQSVHPGETLSFDHTFKIASNIGCIRPDKKWTCQYDSAFLVFNGDGKIVSWQFTKGTSFENVRSLLHQINNRKKCTIKTIYVDNCCQWRQKIREVFGSNVTVLLDIFHAVQRVTRKIPKKHPFHSTCLQDFRLVFRIPGDYGLRRTKPTPQPSELLQNINSFVQRWENVAYNGQNVLTRDSMEEIEKLKVHIVKGCLSGINVGGGTNKNEAFHRYVNTFFHKSRIGVLLAYAMMMTIISHFNNKDTQSRKAVFRPIRLSLAGCEQDNIISLERMGIMNVDRNNEDLTWIQEEGEDAIDPASIKDILSASTSQFVMHKAMKKQSTTSTQLWRYIPYMQVLPNQISSDDNEAEAHRQRLKNNALAWNFSIVPVQSDGNCFFTSVALALVQDIVRSMYSVAFKWTPMAQFKHFHPS